MTVEEYEILVKRLNSRVAELEFALESANDVCRSMLLVVSTPNKSVNWVAFSMRLNESLGIQHMAMYPAKTDDETT